MTDWLREGKALVQPPADDPYGLEPSPLPAGRALDALIATKVMGWTRIEAKDGLLWRAPGEGAARYGSTSGLPHYSTDIRDAWLVVEAMEQRDCKITIGHDFRGVPGKWHVVLDALDGAGYAEGLPLPEAICRAALSLASANPPPSSP